MNEGRGREEKEEKRIGERNERGLGGRKGKDWEGMRKERRIEEEEGGE